MKYLVIITILLSGCYTAPKENLSDRLADLKAAGWKVTRKSYNEIIAEKNGTDIHVSHDRGEHTYFVFVNSDLYEKVKNELDEKGIDYSFNSTLRTVMSVHFDGYYMPEILDARKIDTASWLQPVKSEPYIANEVLPTVDSLVKYVDWHVRDSYTTTRKVSDGRTATISITFNSKKEAQ
jgi:hypothetical protein